MVLNRINYFQNILDLLKNGSQLYNLKMNTPNSLYEGDFGLSKIYENEIYCLLGLKEDSKINLNIECVPQSWMVGKRKNKIIENRRAIYYNNINCIPIELYVE